MRTFVLILSVFLIVSCSSIQVSPKEPGCEITKWGVVKSFGNEQVEVSSEFSGFIKSSEISIFTEQISEIPLQEGIEFGIKYVFHNIADTETIISRVHHPEFRKDDDSSETISDYKTDPTDDMTTWILNRSWEQVKGDWNFEILHDGKVLCSKAFQTN